MMPSGDDGLDVRFTKPGEYQLNGRIVDTTMAADEYPELKTPLQTENIAFKGSEPASDSGWVNGAPESVTFDLKGMQPGDMLQGKYGITFAKTPEGSIIAGFSTPGTFRMKAVDTERHGQDYNIAIPGSN